MKKENKKMKKNMKEITLNEMKEITGAGFFDFKPIPVELPPMNPLFPDPNEFLPKPVKP